MSDEEAKPTNKPFRTDDHWHENDDVQHLSKATSKLDADDSLREYYDALAAFFLYGDTPQAQIPFWRQQDTVPFWRRPR
jgi:hypothetical protein